MKVVPPIHRFHVRSFDFEAWWNPQIGSKGSTGIADKQRCGSGPHRHVSLCWPAKGNLQKIKPSKHIVICPFEDLKAWGYEKRERKILQVWLDFDMHFLYCFGDERTPPPAPLPLEAKCNSKCNSQARTYWDKKGLQSMWDFASHFRFISHRKNKGPRPSHEEVQLEAFNIADWIARSANPIIPYSSHMHCQSFKSKRTWFIRTAKKPLRWPGFIQRSKPAALTRKHIFDLALTFNGINRIWEDCLGSGSLRRVQEPKASHTFLANFDAAMCKRPQWVKWIWNT